MIGRIASSRYGSYKTCNVIIEAEGDLGSLYLGDYTAAIDYKMLKLKGINTVLTVATGLPVSYGTQHQITHRQYPALDIESYNIAKHFPDTYKHISEGLEKGSVLGIINHHHQRIVHCAAGISRSASAVIAYLMKKHQWSYQKAFGLVKSKRSVICPNFGFTKQLRNFERQLNGQEDEPKLQSTHQIQFNPEEEEKSNAYKPKIQNKIFSKSTYKYNSQLLSNQQVGIIQPNIVTYGVNNQLIVKKKSMLPSLNKK